MGSLISPTVTHSSVHRRFISLLLCSCLSHGFSPACPIDPEPRCGSPNPEAKSSPLIGQLALPFLSHCKTYPAPARAGTYPLDSLGRYHDCALSDFQAGEPVLAQCSDNNENPVARPSRLRPVLLFASPPAKSTPGHLRSSYYRMAVKSPRRRT